MSNRKLNPNVPSHIHNQLLKFKSFILQIHYNEDEDFIEEEFSDENLLKGSPAPFMKVLHFCLNEWSSHIANLVLKLEYSFEEKTDWNFMETVFSFMRHVMKTQPGLSLEQFFSQGFTLPKLSMVNTTVCYLVNQHIELRKKANQPKRFQSRVLRQRSEQLVQQNQDVSPRSLTKESQIRTQLVIPTVRTPANQKINVTPKPRDSQSLVRSLVTPSQMVRATPPTQVKKKSDVEELPLVANVPQLTSTPSATSICTKLTPLPHKLLSRVRGYMNAKPENTYNIATPTFKAALNERNNSAQSSKGSRLVHSKNPAIDSENFSIVSEQVVSNECSPQCDVSQLRWKETTDSIRQLKKQIADLKVSQEAIHLKYGKRINELDKNNRNLKKELALCSSRIEFMADRHPKFVKQHDRLRRTWAKSVDWRENEITSETKLSNRSSKNIRVSPSNKKKSYSSNRQHTSAYARPVARAAMSSLPEKPVPSTSRGENHVRWLSKSDTTDLRVDVCGNYDKLMELMKD